MKLKLLSIWIEILWKCNWKDQVRQIIFFFHTQRPKTIFDPTISILFQTQ